MTPACHKLQVHFGPALAILCWQRPNPAASSCAAAPPGAKMTSSVTDRAGVYARIIELIEPLNQKGVALAEDTSFAGDLEMDSLTVMDLVANMEDEWDIVMPLNMLPDLETIGQVADAVTKLVSK
jgi:acyl carrier protein